MLSQRSTPIKLSQEAALKLPRAGLWLVLVCFAFIGFFADDLWTPRDIDSFGAAWLLAQQPLSAWLMPMGFGEMLTEAGPLTTWLSATFMLTVGEQGLGLLSNILCLRLASVFWFTLSTFAIWESAYRLAVRPEAQPIAFAFGGEARPKDFARAIADSAVLLFLATFGILTRQHEAVPDTALLAITALNLFSLTIAVKRPLIGSILAGISVTASILASTLFAGVWLLAQSLIVIATLSQSPRKRDLCLVALLLSTGLLFLIWPALSWCIDSELANRWFTQWVLTQTDYFGPAGLSTYLWFAKHSLWFLLPLWPLVLTGLFRWGRRLGQPFLFLPLVVVAVTLLGVIFSSKQSTDSVFLACIPALTVLAAFSLLTIKNGWENILDWFGLTIFGLGGLTIWLYWCAWLTGFPPKMHQSIINLAPTVRPELDLGFFCAVLATFGWIALVIWRLTHRPVIIWRGPWINATGITMALVVGFGLFHAPTTEFRSLVPIAQTLDRLLLQSGWQRGQCVQAINTRPEMMAVLQHYGAEPLNTLTHETGCPLAIVRQSSSSHVELPDYAPSAGRARSSEVFYVVDTNALARKPIFTRK